MQVAKNKVVTIDYTLTNSEGEVLDSSTGEEPLAYIQGTSSIIPGLERALEGKTAGDNLAVTIAPEDAYGVRDDSLQHEVPREMFDTGGHDINVGMQFQAQSEDGMLLVTVVGVSDDKITVDGNHPLAGVPLTFDVTVRDVRDATEEEISHGHVHGPGDHEH